MWEEKNNKLIRDFIFKDFTEAFSFMTEVAFHCERLNHHPDWRNVWNQVFVSLSTHDTGNTVTEKDRELASIIDQVYNRFIS
jgi:4a-hydroxytetrahydrobiopterin dehydratase